MNPIDDYSLAPTCQEVFHPPVSLAINSILFEFEEQAVVGDLIKGRFVVNSASVNSACFVVHSAWFTVNSA